METSLKDNLSSFENQICSLLKKASERNFNEINEEIVSLILSFRSKLSKSDVKKIIFSFSRKEDWNDYQDEILVDIDNRLNGFCTPNRDLDW